MILRLPLAALMAPGELLGVNTTTSSLSCQMSKRLLLIATASLALAACDAVETSPDHTDPVAPETAPLLRGPSLSMFPEGSLLTAPEAEALVLSSDLLHNARTTGDTTVLVPLVFDEGDLLHSPASFNHLVTSAMEAQRGDDSEGGDVAMEVLYTDLDTFLDVVGTSPPGARRSENDAGLYAAGRRGRVSVQQFAPNARMDPEANAAFVEVYDPYVIPDPVGVDCEDPTLVLLPAECTDNGGPSNSYRGSAVVQRGESPSWPTMWVADVISGVREGGFSAGSSAPLGAEGHTSIITALNTGGNTGGSFYDRRTRVMEAVGYRPLAKSDEVIERPARTYWIDDGAAIDIYVRYHPRASWSQRATAVSYARSQDRDGYSALTPKIDRSQWYCSKLVWASYKEATGDDIDWDWGYYVFPNDIEGSRVLRSAYRFQRSS